MAGTKVELLIRAAVNLSTAAPREWEEFLKALSEYSVETNRRLLSSEPALLANAQGQAVQVDYMLTTLTNARRTTQNAETKRKLRPTNESKSWPLR